MRPLVLSGPSGGGKSTIINKAMQNYPNSFAFSVSHTTRKPREGEVNGVHYWFVSKETFEEMIKDGKFLEYATFGGNIYGTSKKAVEDVLNSGRICILDVELQGVRSIHKCGLEAKYILIRAPTLAVLEERLRARKTETDESLQKRLQHAEEDLKAVNTEPELFDYIIVNDDLDRAYNEFLRTIQDELNEVKNSTGIKRAKMAKNFSRLPALPSLKDFLHIYRLYAKKILSQNYLMDMNLTRKIIRYADVRSNDIVAEIGPGPGSITRAILETECKRLDVIEIDHRFIPALEVLREASGTRMHIHCADILKTDIGKIWLDAGVERMAWHDGIPKLHIIGNLPFNIASPLIIKYLEEMLHRQGPWKLGRVPLTLTFQMEVAERICAPINTPARARISIMSMFVAEPKLVFRIPGRCFVPRPEVDVGVVRFVPREEPLIKTSFKVVEKVCRQVFNTKRKYVRRGVRTLYPKEVCVALADELLARCRIDPTVTCTQIGIEQFADMCHVYEEQCHKHPGIYLYEHFHRQRTMDELAEMSNNLPPPNPFIDHLPAEGITLSKASSLFD